MALSCTRPNASAKSGESWLIDRPVMGGSPTCRTRSARNGRIADVPYKIGVSVCGLCHGFERTVERVEDEQAHHADLVRHRGNPKKVVEQIISAAARPEANCLGAAWLLLSERGIRIRRRHG